MIETLFYIACAGFVVLLLVAIVDVGRSLMGPP